MIGGKKIRCSSGYRQKCKSAKKHADGLKKSKMF